LHHAYAMQQMASMVNVNMGRKTTQQEENLTLVLVHAPVSVPISSLSGLPSMRMRIPSSVMPVL